MKGIRAAVIFWFVLVLALIFAAPALLRAQSVVPPGDQSVLHRIGNRWEAPAFAAWRTQVITGNSSTGSQTILVKASGLALKDGYTMPCSSTFCDPFNTNTPIVVGVGSVAETVTPSGVSVSACPPSAVSTSADFCASVTATFANVHGYAEPVVSGDAGIEEAVTDAAWNGGGLVEWFVDTGTVTLSTGGLTTTTTTKVPSMFINEGASAYVETTITTSANWSVGIASHTADFCASNSTLTSGTACTQVAPTLTGTSTALTAVLFTMGTSNPGAGAIKARVWGETPVNSAF
ncbi:MAG: hypothetical protein ACRD8A_12725 [Candidatus Acidiferrales bacterium]